MKRGQISLVCMLSGMLSLAAAMLANAANPGNSYQSIVDRNIFGLKPPPPPPDPSEINKPKPGKITLTGITTIFGNKRALLKVAVPAKPPLPAKDESYILAEGQRDGDVEILAIDENAGSVKVNNAGDVVTLTFEKDGAKTTPAPNIPSPGMIPPPPGTIPRPGGGGAPAAPNAGARTIPTRTVRTQAQGADAGGVQYGSAPAQPGQVNQSNPQMSPEEQMLLMEAERLRTQEQVSQGKMPPLPPTPLSHVLNEEGGAGGPPGLP